jgi:hypothetical protein
VGYVGKFAAPPFEGQFWGSHYGVVEDPFGTVWAISAPTPGAKRSGGDEAEAEDVGNSKKGQRKSPRTKGVAVKVDKEKSSSAKKRSKKKYLEVVQVNLAKQAFEK